ncbi:hypothetical protein, partial [Klebsiella pneumoniae]|uniref:hypothetical protein n=1 Tax=Klebsiella pneumoniae TaxID=573 RepID=UPI0039C2822F
VVGWIGLHAFQHTEQAGVACVRQKAIVDRRLFELVHQDVGQADIGFGLRDINVTLGKVTEDGLEDVTDG